MDGGFLGGAGPCGPTGHSRHCVQIRGEQRRGPRSRSAGTIRARRTSMGGLSRGAEHDGRRQDRYRTDRPVRQHQQKNTSCRTGPRSSASTLGGEGRVQSRGRWRTWRGCSAAAPGSDPASIRTLQSPRSRGGFLAQNRMLRRWKTQERPLEGTAARQSVDRAMRILFAVAQSKRIEGRGCGGDGPPPWPGIILHTLVTSGALARVGSAGDVGLRSPDWSRLRPPGVAGVARADHAACRRGDRRDGLCRAGGAVRS